MPDLSPEQIDQLARSIALHSAGETGGTGHLPDFNVSDQEGLVTKIKEMLSDPKTEYMVNTSNQPGRSGTVIFFNEESKSILVFNPNNLADPLYDEAGQIISGAKGPDNLAGTFYREPKLNADGVPFEMKKGKEKLLTPETELSRFNKQVRSLKNGIASAISNDTGKEVTSEDIETHKINENDDWAKRISGHDTEIVEGRPKAQQRIDNGEYDFTKKPPKPTAAELTAGEAKPGADGVPDGKTSANIDAPPKANLADDAADALKKAEAASDLADGVKDVSKLAKAGRLGANITGVGVVIGAASLALMDQAHAAQRDFAGDLHEAGLIDDEAYQSYLELNKDTENMLYGDLGISTVDPTGASIVITAAAETKARVDFKEWADEHAPGLSEEHFQTLSMSMFPDNSARAELLLEARDQFPATTEGQPQELHRMIDLNNLYDKAARIGYSHKEGIVHGGNLGETVAQAQAMGIEFEVNRMNPAETISNLRDAVKQELVDEMDTQFSDPVQADNLLNNVPVDDRLEYVRRLASSDDNPEALAQNHPEVAAYIKAYDNSLTGWGWTMSEDDPLKENPELLNAYIKERTLGSPEALEASATATPAASAPEGVTDRTAEIDSILPPGSNITVQSSDSKASLVEGVVPDNQIEVMKNDDESVSLDQMKQQDFELQQRAAQLAAEQQTMDQQRIQTPSQSGP